LSRKVALVVALAVAVASIAVALVATAGIAQPEVT
jgi:hypothetical protein